MATTSSRDIVEVIEMQISMVQLRQVVCESTAGQCLDFPTAFRNAVSEMFAQREQEERQTMKLNFRVRKDFVDDEGTVQVGTLRRKRTMVSPWTKDLDTGLWSW